MKVHQSTSIERTDQLYLKGREGKKRVRVNDTEKSNNKQEL